MTLTIQNTVTFMKTAHLGQKYGDLPYYTHPIEVAMYCNTPVQKIAGLLHDVLEDTAWTEVQLREIFDDEVVDIVVLLTKDKTLTYRQNIQRIIDSGNVDAMTVKLADNTVNFNGDKSQMNPQRAAKLMDRYAMSMEMLTKAKSNE
jgi:(p)ppGpp synthase/HD superfamily hydrolase